MSVDVYHFHCALCETRAIVLARDVYSDVVQRSRMPRGHSSIDAVHQKDYMQGYTFSSFE